MLESKTDEQKYRHLLKVGRLNRALIACLGVATFQQGKSEGIATFSYMLGLALIVYTLIRGDD
jgi:hypothetical protein